MRKAIAAPQQQSFQSHGEESAGLYFRAEGAESEYCFVMARGMAAVKEMRLNPFASAFAAAGYNVFVFDYRYFGESGGEPRQLVNSVRPSATSISSSVSGATAPASTGPLPNR